LSAAPSRAGHVDPHLGEARGRSVEWTDAEVRFPLRAEHIRSLEERLNYLTEQEDHGRGNRYVKTERAALTAALPILRDHHTQAAEQRHS
jgi:hypothetical protein